MSQQLCYKHEVRSYTLGMVEQEDGRSLGLCDSHFLLVINSNHACLGSCDVRDINASVCSLCTIVISYQPYLRNPALNRKPGAALVSFLLWQTPKAA